MIDEARHVESYKRLLHEKFKLAYPITKPLKKLLEQTLTDRRWDMTYLGMQVLIEGLALAAFQRIRDNAQNPLAAAVNAYVMQDEARHVTFGRLALRDYYPQLTRRSATSARSSWSRPATSCATASTRSRSGRRSACRSRNASTHMYDSRLHADVPQLRCSPASCRSSRTSACGATTIRDGYEDMGIIGFADTDVQALQESDDNIAKEFDARRAYVESVAGRAAAE